MHIDIYLCVCTCAGPFFPSLPFAVGCVRGTVHTRTSFPLSPCRRVDIARLCFPSPFLRYVRSPFTFIAGRHLSSPPSRPELTIRFLGEVTSGQCAHTFFLFVCVIPCKSLSFPLLRYVSCRRTHRLLFPTRPAYCCQTCVSQRGSGRRDLSACSTTSFKFLCCFSCTCTALIFGGVPLSFPISSSCSLRI